MRFISSSVLRILLVAAKKLRGKSGTFLLCEPGPHVLDVMKTAGFDRLLDMRDSRDETVTEAAQATALARL
ncbi:MAG: STAS domain-containing protein [Acidobacteriota bacterium]|nr:STAS domain-containing protein [Acidobacteriota bacterium]